MGGGPTSIVSDNIFRKPWGFLYHLDTIVAGIIVVQLIVSSVSSVSNVSSVSLV